MADYIIARESEDDSLEHFGIKGQKWGVRRFENTDGSLTEAGKERYRSAGGGNKLDKDFSRDFKKLSKLDDKANLNLQKERAESKARDAKKTGALAIGALLGAIGADKAVPLGTSKVTNTWSLSVAGAPDTLHGSSSYLMPDRMLNNILSGIGLVSAAALGTTSAITAGQSYAARKRTTREGHAVAVSKSDRQYERMKNKYRGTRYEQELDSYNKERQRSRG